MSDLEELRNKYRPEKIEVLLVGESLPKNNFFYSDNGSRLGKATKKAFENAFQRSFNYREFLEFFGEKGFFLEDLFHERGKDANEAAPSELSEAVKRLAAFIAANRPRVIIAVMCRICECVKATSIMSKTDVLTLCLPFPRGQKYQDYVSGLSEVLLSLQRGSLAEAKVRCSPEANSKARKYCSKIMKEL